MGTHFEEAWQFMILKTQGCTPTSIVVHNDDDEVNM